MKSSLKAVFSGYFDLQKMRIQAGNRIVANFKLRIGQDTGKPEMELDKQGQEILEQIRKAYKFMADAALDLPRISKFEANEVISEYSELVLADIYEKLLLQEERYQKSINQLIHKESLWKEYLKNVPGVGELTALVLLALIDIHKAKYPCSLWKYAGLDVAGDGRARSKRKEHLETKEYLNKDGESDVKQGITYNPILKTKLLGVLGPSFLKCKKGKYPEIYYNYRTRLENRPDTKDGAPIPQWYQGDKRKFSHKLHRHNMATRYMVKIFLIDLYEAWRQLEELEVSKPYYEAKLGIIHSHLMPENQSAEASQELGENHIQRASQAP